MRSVDWDVRTSRKWQALKDARVLERERHKLTNEQLEAASEEAFKYRVAH
jgi:hypothetical protein